MQLAVTWNLLVCVCVLGATWSLLTCCYSQVSQRVRGNKMKGTSPSWKTERERGEVWEDNNWGISHCQLTLGLNLKTSLNDWWRASHSSIQWLLHLCVLLFSHTEHCWNITELLLYILCGCMPMVTMVTESWNPSWKKIMFFFLYF